MGEGGAYELLLGLQMRVKTQIGQVSWRRSTNRQWLRRRQQLIELRYNPVFEGLRVIPQAP